MNSAFACVLDIKASLGECPVWSVEEQVLYWVDINAPTLNRFDPATGNNTAWIMPESIGCFALRASGGFVAALRGGFWFVDAGGVLERKILDAPYDPTHHRFNDGRADRQGRFWAGTMNESRDASTAQLYRLDANLVCTPMIDSLVISNGLAFSPDDRTIYHADTPTRTIYQYDYDVATGAIANRQVFASFTGDGDRPDGGAVDREGCYWTAFYHGGKVVRLSPRGQLIAEFPVPAMCPTMCAFGGAALQTLYVTTASQRRTPDELARLPASGGIFAMQVDVPGLPEPRFAG